MKTNINKTAAQKQINDFFSKSKFTAEQARKIKRLAMKFNIKLKSYKTKFCKKCLSQLRGKIRISRKKKEIYKIIECEKCGYKNKIRIG